MNSLHCRLVFLFASLPLVSVSAADYRLTLAAAPADRAGQVVAIKLPADAPKNPSVRNAAGKFHAVQTDADGTARFVVPWQAAGTTLTFTLTSAGRGASDAVTAATKDGDLALSVGGQPALAFHMDRERLPRADIKPEFKRAGYVHPIFSPAGKLVTDHYAANHVHQHGIWTPWTKTSFQGRSPDFWNMGAKTGAEDFVALDRSWSGPVHGGLVARLKMVDLSAPGGPVTAINETWQLTVYDLSGTARPARMFEIVMTQECATADPLILPQYHYGGFGFRGAWAWNGPGDKARFLTSEGITDRIKGNDTRVRWCYLGGLVDGAMAGTATLGHPENFRAPQPVRLHPNMPYFSLVPQQLGEFRIEPGKPYVARFRFVVMDGEPDRALLDAYWNGYATPAVAKVDAL